MALNPQKWTTKLGEAFSDANAAAATAGNPSISSEHILLAAISQGVYRDGDTIHADVLENHLTFS